MLIFPIISSSETVSEAKGDSVIAKITVGTGPYGDLFDPANGFIYTANGNHFGFPTTAPVDTGNITVINPSTNKVITNIAEPFGHTPRELAFDSANDYIYAADVYSNTVSVIDSRTDTLVTTIPTQGSITDGVAYDSTNGDIYAVNAGGTVSVIDGSKNQVIDTIRVGSNSLTDVFDPDNGYIYVANQLSPSISVIDGSKNQVIGTIAGTPNPIQLSYNPANRYLYVVNYDNTNVVSVIDTRTNTVIDNIPGFSDPAGVGYDSANGNMYVTNQGSNYVSIISGQTNQVIGTVTVGSGPVNPVFDPNNRDVYVTNFHSNEEPGNTVSVISTTTTQLIPPDTTITSAVDGNGVTITNGSTTFSGSIRFTFTATASTNPIVGFQCSLDNSPFSSCNSPDTFNNLAAGLHKFTVVALDSAGNKDPTPASFSWTILTPAQEIEQLMQTIHGMHLNPGTQANLDAQLNGILTTLSLSSKNNLLVACPHLNAFIATVVPDYLHSGELNPNQASQIIQSAQNIQKALGCPIALSSMGASPSMQQEQQSASFNLTNSQQLQPQTTTSSPPPLQSQSQSPYSHTNQNPTLSQIPQSQSGQNLQLRPMANAGISQTVNKNTKVELDGLASHDPNGGTIVAYQWTQLPMGVPITLIGANTATPTFTAPVVNTDTVLGFSLRVMDNHGVVSTNPAVVYIMIKHNPDIGPTGSSNIPSSIITQPQLQQLNQPIIPNNDAINPFPLPSNSGPHSSLPQTGLPAIHSPVVP